MKKSKDIPFFEDSLYRYVGAGLNYRKDMGLQIYVKYCTNPGFKLISHSSTHLWVECPDRTLYIVGNAHNAQAAHPTSGTYDECITTSLAHDMITKDMGIDMFMVNYTQEINDKHSPRTRPTDLETWIKIISDSGGFQIMGGKLDFIDPIELVKWYNRNVDIGIILDIPAYEFDSALAMDFAEIQRKNTELMLRHKDPHLELMNIIHGYTTEDYEKFRAVVEVDEIDRLAVGGIYRNSFMRGAEFLLNAIVNGKNYKQYHILGISNMMQSLIFMKTAAMGFAPLITSDSSTPVQKASNREYMIHRSLGEPIKIVFMGDKAAFSSLSTDMTLPCQCQVCSTIKYADVFNILEGGVTRLLLLYHNIYVLSNYMKIMYGVVKEATDKELKQIIGAQYKKANSACDELMKSLDYVSAVREYGLEGAKKRFSYYLGSKDFSTPTKQLIADKVEEQEDEHPHSNERGEHLIKIYNDFHTQVGMTKAKSKSKKGDTESESEVEESVVYKHGKKNTGLESKGYTPLVSSAKAVPGGKQVRKNAGKK